LAGRWSTESADDDPFPSTRGILVTHSWAIGVTRQNKQQT
jgi:hypothetical protein